MWSPFYMLQVSEPSDFKLSVTYLGAHQIFNEVLKGQKKSVKQMLEACWAVWRVWLCGLLLGWRCVCAVDFVGFLYASVVVLVCALCTLVYTSIHVYFLCATWHWCVYYSLHFVCWICCECLFETPPRPPVCPGFFSWRLCVWVGMFCVPLRSPYVD